MQHSSFCRVWCLWCDQEERRAEPVPSPLWPEAWHLVPEDMMSASDLSETISVITRKSFYSDVMPDASMAEFVDILPPNKILHDMQDVRIQAFLKDLVTLSSLGPSFA